MRGVQGREGAKAKNGPRPRGDQRWGGTRAFRVPGPSENLSYISLGIRYLASLKFR